MTIKQAISAVVEVFKDLEENEEYASEKAKCRFMIEELREVRNWITDDYEVKTENIGGREMLVLPPRTTS